MDLSFLKWPIIILVVVGGGWLLTEGGTNWMYSKLKSQSIGQDETQDAATEASLSRLGGYLIMTFRYDKCADVIEYTTTNFYPGGPGGARHYYHNLYRLAKCREKQGRYQESIQILRDLAYGNAHELDGRVPEFDQLRLRGEKLMETHDIGEVGTF